MFCTRDILWVIINPGTTSCTKGGSFLHCPFCNFFDSKVVNSRSSEEGNAIRRRRECLGCQKRFTTFERIEEIPLVIKKRDGHKENFDRQKLLNSVLKACEKRSITGEKIEALALQIERELYNCLEQEIPSQILGEKILAGLRELDELAYLRFASVYRHYKDATSLVKEAESLLIK